MFTKTKAIKAYAVDTAGNAGNVVTNIYTLNIDAALKKQRYTIYDGNGVAQYYYYQYVYLNNVLVASDYSLASFPYKFSINISGTEYFLSVPDYKFSANSSTFRFNVYDKQTNVVLSYIDYYLASIPDM